MSSNFINENQANYQFATATFMIKTQVDCFNKCLVDFQVKDIQAMEQMCTDDCIRKNNFALLEMKSAEYQRQLF